jgi:hypothetical protein
MLKARKCVREMREYHSPVSDPPAELRLDLNEYYRLLSPGAGQAQQHGRKDPGTLYTA